MVTFNLSDLGSSLASRCLSDNLITSKPNALSEPIEVASYVLNEREETLSLPIAYGTTLANKLNIELHSRESIGHKIEVPKLPNPDHPKAPKGQKKFFDDLFYAVCNQYSTLAVAPTGTGKTVAILNSVGKLERSALIVVPTTTLMTQWVAEIENHLGIDKGRIGTIGGGTSEWEGKDIVVCVIHNLFQKEWGEDFRNYFGYVAWDECHNVGAKRFSESMFVSNAQYKIGVSATPKRKDGLMKVITNHLGNPSVEAESKALPCLCYNVLVNWDSDKKLYAKWKHLKSDVKIMKWLAENPKRNKLISELAFKRWEYGEDIVIITKFINHAHLINDMLVAKGIPQEEVGLFLGQKIRGYKEEINDDGVLVTKVLKSKVKEEELDRIKKDCSIIITTYKKFKEGVDVPRLTTGIEALPIADGVQAVGRIRRKHKDKISDPIWYCFEDRNLPTPILGRYSSAKIKGLQKTGVLVKNISEKGVG